ncbi:hypothetical protein [Acinetobacter bohemicus]|uniref:hypothetical protein n=1 Tax=Acinetobacter bohemicus TaxID=1435036 RepID=UPI001D0DC401|nr:hypothetical protein [Acinetobacter bohemicus]
MKGKRGEISLKLLFSVKLFSFKGLENKFDRDDFMLETRKRLINDWKNFGINVFEESIWSSSVQLDCLPKVRELLSSNGFKYVDISIVRPPDNSSERMKFRTHYDESNQCFSKNYGISIPALSNNLKLTVGLELAIENQECQDKTLRIINTLRLIFGVPVARELMLVTHFNSENFQNAGVASELGYASPFDIQSLNFYDEIEFSKLRNVPIDALILLDKAFQQKFPKERFVLMWVSFEAIINSIYVSDSNGNKRVKYFKEELKSNIVNDEVYRLFKLRCTVFKESKFEHEQFDEENWSLYVALQLAIMEDCPQRAAFLRGYEQTIIERS